MIIVNCPMYFILCNCKTFAKIVTNERDKQNLFCYFAASAVYFRYLMQRYNKETEVSAKWGKDVVC